MANRAQDGGPRDGERIAKLLARAGIASRREVERMIAEGRIAVAGTPVDTPATLLRSLDGVTVDGDPVAAPDAARLFLYHKPVGLLVTERDPHGRPTIYDRLPGGLPRLVPVGRLDLNTEGLLLLTTDGGLKRQLELPATGVERTYRARAYGQVSQAQLEDLIDGVEVEGVRYGRIDANLERRTGANVWIELTLTEGKNREVRRVLEHLGLRVGRLIRTRYGPFVLGDLPPGAVGEVRAHDVESFRANPTRVDLPQPARRMAAALPPARSEPPAAPTAVPPPRRPPAATGRAGSGAPSPAPEAKPAPRQPLRQPPARSTEAPKPRVAGRTGRDAAPAPTAKPMPRQPAARSAEALKPRAARAAAHRAATGRAEPDAPRTPRPARPVRKAGWARPKPRSGPGGPRRK